MAMATTFILPLSLAVFGNVFAENDPIPSAERPVTTEPVFIQCTEVALQYKSGNRLKSTMSNDCAEAGKQN